jgi:hypothetical protein
LIWVHESSYFWRGLGEMGWEDGIFVVNASPCDVLCCALGGNRGARNFAAPKLHALTEWRFYVWFLSFHLQLGRGLRLGDRCWFFSWVVVTILMGCFSEHRVDWSS